jgi:hypothetical protein
VKVSIPSSGKNLRVIRASQVHNGWPRMPNSGTKPRNMRHWVERQLMSLGRLIQAAVRVPEVVRDGPFRRFKAGGSESALAERRPPAGTLNPRLQAFLERSGRPALFSGDRGQETGDRGQKTGDRRQEAGGRRQEAGGRRQEAGGRRQEAGGRRQEAGDNRNDNEFEEWWRGRCCAVAAARCRSVSPRRRGEAEVPRSIGTVPDSASCGQGMSASRRLRGEQNPARNAADE